MKKNVLDASFLISAIRSIDENHRFCYEYFMNHEEDIWLIPTIAYFEYQAAQSRLEKEGKKAYRELFIPNVEIYEISLDFIKRSVQNDLITLFKELKGADLIYACVAKVESSPLITCDKHFEKYSNEIEVINPTKTV